MPKNDKVRYAVVGLGWFAQESILPAFAKAKNSELVALVSGDEEKLRELGERYGTAHNVKYEAYDELLASGAVDAVYIALPNTQHCDYTVRAARAGVHVLCEKPMAMDEAECREMIGACRGANVKLMIAYRLHFEKANMTAVETIKAGEIGEPRIFNSVFTMQVEAGNSRLDLDLNSGPLYDIGVYCINAARYIFRAFGGRKEDDERFDEVEEQIAALLKFPDDRLATFVVSFGAEGGSRYEVIGTKGSIALDPAYSHSGALKLERTVGGKTHTQKFSSRDQITPELVYFSDCIREDRQPEPSGEEGMADIRIVRALYESAGTARAVRVEPIHKGKRPDASQEMYARPHREPDLVNAEPPH
jgi:predicted dehydrogenase